jgi:hypothetical protein
MKKKHDIHSQCEKLNDFQDKVAKAFLKRYFEKPTDSPV